MVSSARGVTSKVEARGRGRLQKKNNKQWTDFDGSNQDLRICSLLVEPACHRWLCVYTQRHKPQDPNYHLYGGDKDRMQYCRVRKSLSTDAKKPDQVSPGVARSTQISHKSRELSKTTPIALRILSDKIQLRATLSHERTFNLKRWARRIG